MMLVRYCILLVAVVVQFKQVREQCDGMLDLFAEGRSYTDLAWLSSSSRPKHHPPGEADAARV
jgi:hypothetical protein